MSKRTVKLTFLPYISGDHDESSKKQVQASQRHQHTALISHRKRREQRRKESEDRAVISKDGETCLLKSPKSSSKPRSNAAELLTGESNSCVFFGFSTVLQAPHHPRTPLGNNRFGPFKVFADAEVCGDSQMILDHAFALSLDPDAISRIKRVAFNAAMLAPHTLYAIIYSGECYRSFFAGRTKSTEIVRLNARAQALRSLREAMQRADGEISEEMILTITLLAIHGSIRPDKRGNTVVPLYRDNEFYSTVQAEQAHLQALRSFVIQRGGVRNLALHGLADLVALADIWQSQITLDKPKLEPLRPTHVLIESFQEKWDDEGWHTFRSYGDGFSFLDAISEDASELKLVIYGSRVVLVTYDVMLRHPENPPDFIVMVLCRRALQYDGLMLDHFTHPMAETTRLCILVCLAELVQPMPSANQFHSKITPRLRDSLDECTRLGFWTLYPEFLFWATILSGFAARGRPISAWFASQLSNAPLEMRNKPWSSVQTMSKMFLPLDYATGEACRTFWEGVCNKTIPVSSPHA